MKEICPLEKCVGCWSCLNSCVHQAIRVEKDVCGFRYPRIDSTKCVDCGLCRSVCPVINKAEMNFPKACYAVKVKSEKELATCASGGAASAISRYIIRMGGIVYGCSGDDIRHVRHIRVVNEENLSSLKGSKYVQSDLNTTFCEVKADLKSGKRVLFIGTPCQVGGLKAFLRHEYPNLVTIDLVCHGVPSQQLLNDNLDYYHTKEHDFAENTVHFREKKTYEKNQIQSAKIEYGWFFSKNQPYSLISKRKAYYKDAYMFGFLRGLFFRECCYRCAYAYSARIGDLTLSDFWGLSPDSGMLVGQGVSSVLLNTEKGCNLFRELGKEVDSVSREIQESIMGNGQLQHPSFRHPHYEKFRTLYPRYGLVSSVWMCLWKDKVKLYVKKILGCG